MMAFIAIGKNERRPPVKNKMETFVLIILIILFFVQSINGKGSWEDVKLSRIGPGKT